MKWSKRDSNRWWTWQITSPQSFPSLMTRSTSSSARARPAFPYIPLTQGLGTVCHTWWRDCLPTPAGLHMCMSLSHCQWRRLGAIVSISCLFSAQVDCAIEDIGNIQQPNCLAILYQSLRRLVIDRPVLAAYAATLLSTLIQLKLRRDWQEGTDFRLRVSDALRAVCGCPLQSGGCGHGVRQRKCRGSPHGNSLWNFIWAIWQWLEHMLTKGTKMHAVEERSTGNNSSNATNACEIHVYCGVTGNAPLQTAKVVENWDKHCRGEKSTTKEKERLLLWCNTARIIAGLRINA